MNTTKLLASLTLAAATVSMALPLQAAVVPAGTELAADQIFRRGIGSEPASLDPQKVEGSPGGYVVRDLFEGLVTQDGDGNTIPAPQRAGAPQKTAWFTHSTCAQMPAGPMVTR